LELEEEEFPYLDEDFDELPNLEELPEWPYFEEPFEEEPNFEPP